MTAPDEALRRELAEARADRQALTKALTGLTCNGSEFFIRRGDEYVADIEACVAWIRRSRESQQAAVKSALAKRCEAEAENAALTARIAALEAENSRKDEALTTLVELFDCYRKSDANHECAHQFLVDCAWDAWEKARASIGGTNAA